MEVVHSSNAVTEQHGHGHSISKAQQNHLLKFGWWLYIASEVMLFSSVIGVFLLAKRQYPESGEHFNILLTGFATFVLLVSSWTIVRSLASIQQGDVVGLQRGLFLTLFCGVFFTLVQGYEYVELSHHGVTLRSDMYGGAFYLLTGLHGLHVIIGWIWIGWAFVKALNGHFTANNWIGIEVLGLYWHFVDVVWIIIFPLIYLM